MNYKYLSDGRKVIVLGKLNSQEMIVQEIFIDSQGNEIPSGESFTAKSLHDSPVRSYQEIKLENTENKIKNLEQERDRLYEEIRTVREKAKGYREIFESITALQELLPKTKFETLIAFLTGSIKYIVDVSYTLSKPLPFDEQLLSYDNFYSERRYEGLKLVSMFGKTDGDIEYRINQYRDGSGSWTIIYPFDNYEKAIEFIKQEAIKRIEENKLSEKSYKNCIDMGIIFPKEIDKIYKTEIIKENINCIKSKKNNIQELKKQITELETEIKELNI